VPQAEGRSLAASGPSGHSGPAAHSGPRRTPSAAADTIGRSGHHRPGAARRPISMHSGLPEAKLLGIVYLPSYTRNRIYATD